jgi:hypothetical protein
LVVFAFSQRRNEQVRLVERAAGVRDNAAASVLQLNWLIHRSKFKFRAQRGVVAWASVPQQPAKRSLASTLQRAWRCHCARTRFHAQRKQVWEATVLPTLSKYGRGVQDLAASMYADIILRAARQAPAPDFSSLHAAVLHSAQQRVLGRTLSRMVSPKYFANADHEIGSPKAAAAASPAAADDNFHHTSHVLMGQSISPALADLVSSFPLQMSWAEAVVPQEDAAAAAAAAIAAEAAAIASEAKAAADKQAALQARTAAAAQAAIDAQVAREAQAAAAARAATEAHRAHEEKLAAQAQAAADAKAAAEAKATARAQAAAEAKSAAQAILATRAKAAAEAQAISAARSILSFILTSAELKITALSRAKAQAFSAPATAAAASPAVYEQRFAQSHSGSPITPAQAHARLAAASPSSPDANAWQIEFENAVAAMIVADENAFTIADADSSYFDRCLQQTDFPQNADAVENEHDDCSPDLQAVIDEISRFL